MALVACVASCTLGCGEPARDSTAADPGSTRPPVQREGREERQRLSHGRLTDDRQDERPYVILDERRLGDFHDYQVVMEDARLRSVKLDGFTLVGTYRRYFLIGPGPPR